MSLTLIATNSQDICVKLDVADVNKLLPALDEVEAALRLFPQLRSFVASIDTLVWNTDQPNRKLDETLQALQSWAGVVGEVNALRKFRGEVHLLVGIPESGRSEGACLEALRGVKEAAERKVKERVEVGFRRSRASDASGIVSSNRNRSPTDGRRKLRQNDPTFPQPL